MEDKDIVKIRIPVWEFEEFGGGTRLVECLVNIEGDVWEFHKFDKDPFPSVPHGHNREKKQKLDSDLLPALKCGASEVC